MKTTGIKEGMHLLTHEERAFITWRCEDGSWRLQEIEYGNEEGLFWSPIPGVAESLKEAKEFALTH